MVFSEKLISKMNFSFFLIAFSRSAGKPVTQNNFWHVVANQRRINFGEVTPDICRNVVDSISVHALIILLKIDPKQNKLLIYFLTQAKIVWYNFGAPNAIIMIARNLGPQTDYTINFGANTLSK